MRSTNMRIIAELLGHDAMMKTTHGFEPNRRRNPEKVAADIGRRSGMSFAATRAALESTIEKR